MATLFEVTGELLDLAEFLKVLHAKNVFDLAEPGADVKEIALKIGVSIPNILASAKVTIDVHQKNEVGEEAVRIYLSGDHKHPKGPVDLKRRCIRICIWWRVCFQVCWVCEDEGCYLDIRRVN